MSAVVRDGESFKHYQPKRITWDGREISRFILGSNPFGGYAHQTKERDNEMVDWYTMERVKQCYKKAEAAGITTTVGRTDDFILRALREFRNEGGAIQWIAQTCPGVGTFAHGINTAVRGNAIACFLHGGELDYRVAGGETTEVFDAIKMIKDHGMLAGCAGHCTDTIQWAADNLDLDFFMTCYYNPDDRRNQANRNYDVPEYYGSEHRDAMCALIQQLPAPAIHYKVLAAGRNDPAEAFAYVATKMRPLDACCVGMFLKDDPDMIQKDIDFFEGALGEAGK
ncbi:MAG: hypothetical protein KJ052_02380 [Candidatus Hydrogenedentes bacterium]|nr:hypothetical protein [Candidatus Hydrogenedentota bacterium]